MADTALSDRPLRRALTTLLSGRVVAGLLQVAFIALLARSFGVETYGWYVAFLAGVYLAMNAFDFGFGTRLLRIAAEEDASSTATWMFLIRSTTNLVIIVLGVLVWGWTAQEPLVLGWAVVVYATGETFGDVGLGYLLGRGQVRTSAALLMARRIAAVTPFVTGTGLAQGAAALFAAGAAGWIAAYLAMRSSFTRPRRFRAFVRNGVAYWGLSGVANLKQTDTILVAAVAGPAVAGLYGAATRLLGPLNLVTSVLQQVFVPRLSALRSLPERRAQWQILFRATSVVCGLLVLGSFASPVAVDLLFGDEFRNGWPVLAAVCIAAALNGLSEAYLSWIYAEGARVRLSLLSGGAILIGLIVLTLLCWRFGIVGAAAAVIVPYLLLTLLYRHVGRSARTAPPDAPEPVPAVEEESIRRAEPADRPARNG
ncbi:lipopolysaccharide biosynthesis protein [Geodermatophilus sp. SYSU D00758]